MIIVGIDPGLDGAIASLNGTTLIAVDDTPTFSAGNAKRALDAHGMRELLKRHCGEAYPHEVLVAIESQTAMPKQGVASTFKTGRGFGLWEGLVIGLGMQLQLAIPKMWKAEILVGFNAKDKASSRIVCQNLFPDAATEIERVKDHGRAEAILIAEYARRKQG